MKKTISILFSMFMILSLAACGNSDSDTEKSSTNKSYAEGNTSNNTSIENNNTSAEDSNTDNKEGTSSEKTQTQETEVSKVQETNVLVVYFSATNTTEGVAEHIANGLNAKLYEIVPKEPYTSEDLNYNDNNSRSTIEMNNSDSRPEISGSVENMEQYDIVFIGYPIWWSEAPRIVDTFMESYDFSGKTIVPFCTSGGSGIGSSAKNLENLTSGANWLSGKRLNGSDSQDTVMEWVNSLDLNIVK